MSDTVFFVYVRCRLDFVVGSVTCTLKIEWSLLAYCAQAGIVPPVSKPMYASVHLSTGDILIHNGEVQK